MEATYSVNSRPEMTSLYSHIWATGSTKGLDFTNVYCGRNRQRKADLG